MQPVLQVQDLRKAYDDKFAVDSVSFDVNRREIVGLLGPNGAGKTTTINMVLGILTPDSGAVTIDGLNVGRQRSKALEKTNFAAVYAPLPGNLTVLENLTVFSMIYNVPDRKSRIEELIGTFDLKRFAHTRFGLLSSGEQTRASLAKAMLNRPRLLLLDEPTASLDPATARDIRDSVRQFATTGESCVLWTSHNMQEVVDVCDRVLFLSRGKIVMEGDPKLLPATHGEATLEDLFVRIAREPLSQRAAS